jgi:hypothetical protein
MSMTLEEFRQYYESHRGVVSSIKAYDTSKSQWVGVDELFLEPGAYTLIVVKFKNNTFLRVDVKPALQVRLGPGKYSRAGTWTSLGINLTYEEKEFLGTLGDKDRAVAEIIGAVEVSSFNGKVGLLAKLKKAAEKMGR